MNGEELKTRRKALNLTQAELGEYLGVAGNTVARWERDELAIPPYLSRALSDLERELKKTQS